MIYGAGPSGDERRRWKRKEEKRKENRCGCEGKSCEAENASLHAGHPNKTRDSSSSIGNYTREVLLVVDLLHCFDNGGTKPSEAESAGESGLTLFSDLCELFSEIFNKQ